MFAGFVEQVNQLARARPAANALIAFLSLGFGEDLRYEGLMSMTWRNLSTVAHREILRRQCSSFRLDSTRRASHFPPPITGQTRADIDIGRQVTARYMMPPFPGRLFRL